jgi:hypothetical protein
VADLHDVQLTTPTDGQVLRYDSGVFENDTLDAGDVGAVALPNYGMLSLTEDGYSVPESCSLGSGGSVSFTGARPRNTYAPFVITKAINISAAILNVTGTSATGIVNAFIVPAGDDWNPVPSATPLQIMTNIACATTGFKEETGLDITLQSGRYHIVHVMEVDQASFRLFQYTIDNINYIINTSINNVGFFLALSAPSPLSPIVSAITIGGAGVQTPILLKWTYV